MCHIWSTLMYVVYLDIKVNSWHVTIVVYSKIRVTLVYTEAQVKGILMNMPLYSDVPVKTSVHHEQSEQVVMYKALWCCVTIPDLGKNIQHHELHITPSLCSKSTNQTQGTRVQWTVSLVIAMQPSSCSHLSLPHPLLGGFMPCGVLWCECLKMSWDWCFWL